MPQFKDRVLFASFTVARENVMLKYKVEIAQRWQCRHWKRLREVKGGDVLFQLTRLRLHEMFRDYNCWFSNRNRSSVVAYSLQEIEGQLVKVNQSSTDPAPLLAADFRQELLGSLNRPQTYTVYTHLTCSSMGVFLHCLFPSRMQTWSFSKVAGHGSERSVCLAMRYNVWQFTSKRSKPLHI